MQLVRMACVAAVFSLLTACGNNEDVLATPGDSDSAYQYGSSVAPPWGDNFDYYSAREPATHIPAEHLDQMGLSGSQVDAAQETYFEEGMVGVSIFQGGCVITINDEIAVTEQGNYTVSMLPRNEGFPMDPDILPNAAPASIRVFLDERREQCDQMAHVLQ